MDEQIEAIRAAVADGATAEQKAYGAQACRTILAAFEAAPGKPLAAAHAPAPHPLASIDPGQALDLLIAKLTASLPAEDKQGSTAPTPAARPTPGLRIAFVTPPPRRTVPRPRPPQARRRP